MGRFRLSIRGLILATLLVGFDVAVLIRADQHGRWAELEWEFVVGSGLIVAGFNAALWGLAANFAKLGGTPKGTRWTAPASPLVISFVYLAVLTVPILALLFFAPGRF